MPATSSSMVAQNSFQTASRKRSPKSVRYILCPISNITGVPDIKAYLEG